MQSNHPGAWTTSNLGSHPAYEDIYPLTPNLNVSRLTGLQRAEAAKKFKSQTNSPHKVRQYLNGELNQNNLDLPQAE